MHTLRIRQMWTIVSLVVLIPAGFYTKFYTGPAANWVNNSLGGVFYEIFWCLLIFLFFSSVKAWTIALFVLTITCILEFLQLCHTPVLEWIRGFFIGWVVLGTSFTWFDFPYYFLGCGIGWWWIRQLEKRGDSRQRPD